MSRVPLKKATPRVLRLPLTYFYFLEILSRKKKREYRLVTPYWTRRIVGRVYDEIELTWGYPKKGDAARRAQRPWRGYTVETITHPHFGPEPVEVYAIKVND